MKNCGVIRSMTKNSDDYNEKHKKIKFDWDDDLPRNNTIESHNATIVLGMFFIKITNIIDKFSQMNLYKLQII